MLAKTHATTANQLIELKSISASFGYEYRIFTCPPITNHRPNARQPSVLEVRRRDRAASWKEAPRLVAAVR
jgi:hypothetical protein